MWLLILRGGLWLVASTGPVVQACGSRALAPRKLLRRLGGKGPPLPAGTPAAAWTWFPDPGLALGHVSGTLSSDVCKQKDMFRINWRWTGTVFWRKLGVNFS